MTKKKHGTTVYMYVPRYTTTHHGNLGAKVGIRNEEVGHQVAEVLVVQGVVDGRVVRPHDLAEQL